ncbi:MAG: FAD-dependent oxidoreductase [Dehalococcoidia bacterium]|nr:FAD-dependent oxidoreductase [Dehalococcoidia bacterium]
MKRKDIADAVKGKAAKHYDVIIIGSGPAGIFAALELSQKKGLKVLLLEKGHDLEKRKCKITRAAGGCSLCMPCNMVSGLGGAGAYSDGKLTLSSEVGGRLGEMVDRSRLDHLIDYVDELYIKYGAPQKVCGDGEGVEALKRKATMAELKLIPVRIRHMGSDRSRQVLRAMRNDIVNGIEIRTDTEARHVLVEGQKISGVLTGNGEILGCDYVIAAPGREGADWLSREAQWLGLKIKSNPVDVGVRVEVAAPVLEELTSALYEGKLEYYSKMFDNRLRTFCMCPGGEVIIEATGGDDPVITVNGASSSGRKTANTNFAILVSTDFTEPFHEPIAYGKYLARLANFLSGGVLIQRLGDLMDGHRSTPERIKRSVVIPTLPSAVPGDLSFVLPYRHLISIIEMLKAMDRLAPGVASRHTLIYGVEVKFYSSQLELSANLETGVRNLFAAGDGAGVSRGLVQASVCGVIAAREILKRVR